VDSLDYQGISVRSQFNSLILGFVLERFSEAVVHLEGLGSGLESPYDAFAALGLSEHSFHEGSGFHESILSRFPLTLLLAQVYSYRAMELRRIRHEAC
jgi:hypothetical protein